MNWADLLQQTWAQIAIGLLIFVCCIWILKRMVSMLLVCLIAGAIVWYFWLS